MHSSSSRFRIRSELEINLTLQLSTSSFGIDLAERTRVDAQIGIAGCRMVEDIACIVDLDSSALIFESSNQQGVDSMVMRGDRS